MPGLTRASEQGRQLPRLDEEQSHPPYLPNLAPSDFSPMKEALRGKRENYYKELATSTAR